MSNDWIWLILQIGGYGGIAGMLIATIMALYDLIRGAPYLSKDESIDEE